MNYNLNKKIKDDNQLRKSFNNLALKTYDLSFEDWYKNGYWTDKYIPYTLFDGEKAVSNVSVNLIDTIWQGKLRKYIQLGTVMTDEEYRNKGLSRYIMEIILQDWQNKCDAMYLFANSSVLEFYPKFGFQKENEYQYEMPVISNISKTGKIKKLDMLNTYDRDLLKKYYTKSNPFSALLVINNYSLLMFYCSSIMKDFIYYCEDFDAVIIAAQDGENLICYDIYCDYGKSMPDIVSTVVNPDINNIIFGFTPKDPDNYSVNTIKDEDAVLFVLKDKENIFTDSKIMFPVLSHA